MSTDVKEMIKMKIASKKVMVFSKTYCGFCRTAKSVMKKYLGNLLAEDEYEVMEIDNDPNCNQIQTILQKMTGARSVPRVFINGKCIGGGDETAALDRKGELKKMLSC
ncbi:hypothetical protein ScPMuIL_018877 [Solemya velum]